MKIFLHFGRKSLRWNSSSPHGATWFKSKLQTAEKRPCSLVMKGAQTAAGCSRPLICNPATLGTYLKAQARPVVSKNARPNTVVEQTIILLC
jgi:hypothetical protein